MQEFVMVKPKNTVVMFWSFLLTFGDFPFGWHFVTGIQAFS